MVKYRGNSPLLLAITFLSFILSTVTPQAAPQPPTTTPGGLLFFNSETLFEAAFLGLPKEDFEESTVPPSTRKVFPEPLNNTTDVTGAFQPGDILEGIQIQTAGGGF